MSIIIGSARIDENGNISGGKAGDQTGREVSTQEFYMHSKGWYRLRPKRVDHANALAASMLNACNNNNIGYDQTNRSAVSMVKKYKSTKAIAERTETDCGNLVRACIYEATGRDVGEFYTGNEASALENSGLFESRKTVSSSADVCNGDVLVTKSKGHTVIVVSGRSRGGSSGQNKPATPSSGTGLNRTPRWVGKVTATSLNVRSWAGKENPTIKSWPLLSKGNLVDVCDDIKAKDGSTWYYIRIDGRIYGFVHSGYIARA